MILFDKLYQATEKAWKSMKKPIVARELKRKFAAWCDAAYSAILTSQEGIVIELQKVDTMSIDAIQKAYKTIKAHLVTIDMIKDLYKKLFNEELSAQELPSDIFEMLNEYIITEDND